MTTWEPRYVVAKAPGVGGDPVPADEPVLVVRAQDELALEVLARYLAVYMDRYRVGEEDPVVADGLNHVHAITAWQATYPERVKRADR